MNNEEILEQIKKMHDHAQKIAKSKKESREFLIKTGIYTKKGKLRKEYR